MVHHLFEKIPWYHTGEAVRLTRTMLIENGVVERRSLLRLLKGWYIDGHPHRSPWPG